MKALRKTNANLEGVVPYDSKYLPAWAMLSANENPEGLPEQVAELLAVALGQVQVNRYPDPLANGLRDAIARAWGLSRDNVLVGNGGDELLFNIAFAWGGSGRTMLDMPPTFSVYAANARLCGTRVLTVPRVLLGEQSCPGDAAPSGFAAQPANEVRECSSGWYCRIDEEAVLARLSQGDIDYTTVCSPNNPTGDVADLRFIERVLESTDALVLVDEAYGEFGGSSAVSLLADHDNLAILRTFSKAYSLAGVRVGYVLASPAVVTELIKVRQPYSVDALSQVVATCAIDARLQFAERTQRIVAERERVLGRLRALEGVHAWRSEANYLLFRPQELQGSQVWQKLYDAGILVRDFSVHPQLDGCLRVSIGTPDQNDAFLSALEAILEEA